MTCCLVQPHFDVSLSPYMITAYLHNHDLQRFTFYDSIISNAQRSAIILPPGRLYGFSHGPFLTRTEVIGGFLKF